MAILVTGGSGFIGRHVVRMLLGRGMPVRLLARHPGPLPSSAGAEVIQGDIMDKNSVSRAVAGCTEVIHLAAFARAWCRDASLFERINVQGTRNLLEAAQEHHVRRFIHASSCGAVRFSTSPGDEDSMTEPHVFYTEYARTKFLAEKEVQRFLQKGLSCAIVYPTRVYGPGRMTEGNSATKIIGLYLRGMLPFVIEHGRAVSNWAYVEDVARGIILALESGEAGHRYLLGGENVSLNDTFDLVDRISGRSRLRIHLPRGAVYAFARFEDVKARVLGIKPFVTIGWAKSLYDARPMSSEKATRTLGYQITPFPQAMEKTIRWIQA